MQRHETLHEFAVIEKYFKVIARAGDGVVLGPGDDCAILSPPAGHDVCVSTDTLLEAVHFPTDSPPALIAQRTVTANLSDLAAMGARPWTCLLAMTLPHADEVWLQAFSARLASLLDDAGIALVGGNLSRGSAISLTMTVQGLVPAGQAIRRDGARADDGIFVTGTPGDARQGLELTLGGETGGYLAGRYAEPTARLNVGMALRGLATAMIDVSDGLAADLGHLLASSGMGAEVLMADLPISDALTAKAGVEQARRFALFGGDDYELCFTAPASAAPRLEQIAAETGVPITRIGQVTGEGQPLVVLDPDGKPLADLAGYEHF